ncbi:SH3 domain-containing kinase-binding protein 1-like isoform X2 [Passer montanus]|uniref:SH3 domain-containing kinase-binding protein 1-like isoform X2 n=1 Tax=Passer montanus TaxID=9160 RepID=UPI00196109CF|nr:SH3 domain-containing kinase-binding protein 1-like isoform X2 [Passer montanus]
MGSTWPSPGTAWPTVVTGGPALTTGWSMGTCPWPDILCPTRQWACPAVTPGFSSSGMLLSRGWWQGDTLPVPQSSQQLCLLRLTEEARPQRGWGRLGEAGTRLPPQPDEPLCPPAAATREKNEEGEDRSLPELPAPARMEPTKLPLTKRMAPAPPIPAKTKPAPVLASKPSDPSASADMEWGRAGDPDANGFNTVSVTTARLSHPTATRPRVPGQRPPSLALGSTGGPHGGEQPQGLPRAALCAPVPSTGQAPVPPWSTEGLEGRALALEDLKAEVRTLHILVDLMRVQHLRDLQDLRQELCQEQAQRQALQAEIERVWKGLPC